MDGVRAPGRALPLVWLAAALAAAAGELAFYLRSWADGDSVSSLLEVAGLDRWSLARTVLVVATCLVGWWFARAGVLRAWTAAAAALVVVLGVVEAVAWFGPLELVLCSEPGDGCG